MPTIGIVGGLSWPSTITYYRQINEAALHLTNGQHTAKMVIDSWDFPPAAILMHEENWTELETMLMASLARLSAAGADVIGLACNTLHRCVSPATLSASPVLHILDPLCAEIRRDGYERLLLVGTKFTADSDLYRNIIESQTNATVHTMRGADLETVHSIIFDHLVKEDVPSCAQAALMGAVLSSFEKTASDAVVLGCTELCLAIDGRSIAVPVLDTTFLHAQALAQQALQSG